MSEETGSSPIPQATPLLRLTSVPVGVDPMPNINTGLLYKKNNAPGLFWQASGEEELDLTIAAGGGISRAGASTDRAIALWSGENGSALMDSLLLVGEQGQISILDERVIYHQIASNNIWSGSSSGIDFTNGENNTTHGGDSLRNLLTGSDNLGLGYLTGFTLSNGSGCIFVGARADSDAASRSNVLVLGTDAVSVPHNNSTVLSTNYVRNVVKDTVLYYDTVTGEITYGDAPAGGGGGGGDNLGNHTATQQLRGVVGSADAPGYSFVGDLNTGIYSSISDTINFSTGGTERMSISSTIIVPDTPIEFRKDGAGNQFDILRYQNGVTDTFAGVTMTTARGTRATPTGVQSGDRLMGLLAKGFDDAGNQSGVVAGVFAEADQTFTAVNRGTRLTFNTVANNSTTLLERLRIDNTGGVRIGGAAAANAQAVLHLDGSGTRGLLHPTSTTVQRTALSNTLGMSVVDSTDKTMYYNDGVRWVSSGDLRIPVTAGENLAAGDIVYLNSAGQAVKYVNPWLSNINITNIATPHLTGTCVGAGWDNVNKVFIMAYVFNTVGNTTNLYIRAHRINSSGVIETVQGEFLTQYTVFNDDEFLILNIGPGRWTIITKTGIGGQWHVGEFLIDANLTFTHYVIFRAENAFGPNNSDFRIDAVYCPNADKIVAVLHSGNNIESYVMMPNGTFGATIGAGTTLMSVNDNYRDLCIVRYVLGGDDGIIVAADGHYVSGVCTAASNVIIDVGIHKQEVSNYSFAGNAGPISMSYDSSTSIAHIFKDSGQTVLTNGFMGAIDVVSNNVLIAQPPTVRMPGIALTAIHSDAPDRNFLVYGNSSSNINLLSYRWANGQFNGVYNYGQTTTTVNYPLSARQNRRCAFVDPTNNFVVMGYINATNGRIHVAVVMTNDYSTCLGVVQNSANTSGTATVAPRGSISRAASGLTPGQKYYINSSAPQGVTTTAAYNELLGIALTSTSLLLLGPERNNSNQVI